MNVRSPQPQDERSLELLADRALEGLADAEERELELLSAGSASDDAAAFERAVAALTVALTADSIEPMPASIRSRIEASAPGSRLGATPAASNPRSTPAPTAPSGNSSDDRGDRDARIPASGRIAGLGWYVAAAAALLAVVSWWPRLAGAPEATGQPGPRELWAELESASDARVSPWEDPLAEYAGREITGEVVWSNERQEGVMVFEGLPVNDPSVEQYQLWILDESEEHPIDGGVFDGTSTAASGAIVDERGRLIVPVDAKIRVEKPTAFAVTIEEPGGVVVSTRERLVLLAKLGA